MKTYNLLFVFLISCLFINCSDGDYNDDDATQEINPITIGAYTFTFPEEFNLEELQGIDSYVGAINGPEFSLSFDYGWYTRSATGLSPTEFNTSVDTLQGHYRQIVRAMDPSENLTRLHIYKVSDSINSPFGYNSLTMYSGSITEEQQNLIIEVFNTMEID